MKMLVRLRRIALTVMSVAAFSIQIQALASCRFPTPDGGKAASPPNLVGRLVSSDRAVLVVKSTDGKHEKTVRILPGAVFYTAFGGDDQVETLRLGVAIRVWFDRCLAVQGSQPPIAAWIEVFSRDPADVPPKSYLIQ